MGRVSLPRLLTIMGSGETSPTMVKTHRALLERMGPPPVPAVLLDTPFGFQENAADLTEKAIGYFAESVGATIEVAGFRSAADQTDAVAYERMLDRLRRARYVFAGPGSPSYALSQWAASAIPGILADKLERGGAITFASAAALTLGVVTVPVYEIYKVGAAPEWLPGLDLLAAAGLSAAVIPHYNNAEGGNHDTRFCYLGERRLRMLEEHLPAGAFVLGVDEHTGCVLDLDEGTATVVGLGVMTVRVEGRSTEVASGESMAISDLGRLVADLRAGAAETGTETQARASETGMPGAMTGADGPIAVNMKTVGAHPPDGSGTEGGAGRGDPGGRLARSPLLSTIEARQQAFDRAVTAGDADGAVREVLGLDDDLVAWSTDSLQSDERDRGRSALRSMIVRLGELAVTGLRDPRETVGPFVELILGRRRTARAEKRFAEADSLRDDLVALGVEIQDSPDGTQWALRSGAVGAD